MKTQKDALVFITALLDELGQQVSFFAKELNKGNF